MRIFLYDFSSILIYFDQYFLYSSFHPKSMFWVVLGSEVVNPSHRSPPLLFLLGTFYLKYKYKYNNNPKKSIYHLLTSRVLNLFLASYYIGTRAGNKYF